MKVEIVYDSSTGTTKKAAQAMAKQFEAAGHTCGVQTVYQADSAAIAEADLICVGSWVKGLFIIGQRPTPQTLEFIQALPSLDGKKALAFCTYKVAVGSSLSKMANGLQAKGAQVVGKLKYRGPEPTADFAALLGSL